MSNEKRISARIDDDTYALLEKATALSGVKSVSSFIVLTSVKEAKGIVLAEKLSRLSDIEIDKLLSLV